MSDRRPLSPGAEPPVLSPRQFHDQVESALRSAIGEGDAEPGLRALAAILEETPTLGVSAPHPATMVPILVDGVRAAIARRQVEPLDRDHLLAELMDFVLVFYPEAVPPPSWPLR